MNREQWATRINQIQKINYPTPWVLQDGKSINLVELPISLDAIDSVGNSQSYHLMPNFIVAAIKKNRYHHKNRGPSIMEMGLFHHHPSIVFEGFDAQLAERIGEYMLQMTLSPNDVYLAMRSPVVFNRIFLALLNEKVNVSTTFLGITGLNNNGDIIESRFLDFGDIGGSQEIKRIWNMTQDTVIALDSLDTENPNPDVLNMAENWYYEISGLMKDSFGPGTTFSHIGK